MSTLCLRVYPVPAMSTRYLRGTLLAWHAEQMSRTRQPGLLLGEWACLGALVHERAHGFAVAKRLAPDGDIGRVWTMSRPLTYRALDILVEHGMIRAVAEVPGTAGPNRVMLAPTPKGRAAIKTWLRTPVNHLRDIRGELLLKLVLADLVSADPAPLIDAQLAIFCDVRDSFGSPTRRTSTADGDPVTAWRRENANAAVRFLAALAARKDS